MLFAVALFALLMSLIYGSYIYSARTITRCQNGYEPFRDGLRLQKLLSRMIGSASGSKQRNAKATFDGDESKLSFTTLNRQGYDPEHAWPIAFCRVTVDDDGMTVITHPTWWLLDKGDPSEGTKQVFSSVKSVKFEYLDGKDWVREWDAGKKGKLPRGVKLELKLGGDKQAELGWTFQVALPARADLPIVGAAGVPGFPGGPGGPGGIGGPGVGGTGGAPNGNPGGFVLPPGGLAPAQPIFPGRGPGGF